MFGFTEKQIAGFGMTFGVAAFMAYMLFIVWKLAKDSGAGRTGTIVLFFVLGFGMLGFIVKGILQYFLDI